jgi:hypothetical protein
LLLPKIDAGRSVRQRVFAFDGATSITTGLWEIQQVLVFPKTRRPRGGTIEEEYDFAP